MKELQSGREFLRQWLHLQIHQWDPLLQQYHHLRLTLASQTQKQLKNVKQTPMVIHVMI